MLNSIRKIACAIAIGFAACAAQAQVPLPAPINQIFPDSAMAEAVASSLGHNLERSVPVTEVVDQAVLDRITRLGFSARSLIGIGYLRRLQYLQAFGGITEIPAEIGHLRELQSLFLGANKLATLPTAIGELSALQELDLQANIFTTLPDEIGRLQNLRSLNLSSNSLTSLPASLKQLTELKELRAYANKLETFPAWLGELKALQILILSSNELKSLPAVISDLKTLRYLELSNNKISQLPKGIGALGQLRELYLADNIITSLPPEIGLLASLETLNLQGNKLATIPDEIKQLRKLSTLNLGDNAIEVLPSVFKELGGVSVLYLANNRLVVGLPDELLGKCLGVTTHQRATLPISLGRSQEISFSALTARAPILTQLRDDPRCQSYAVAPTAGSYQGRAHWSLIGPKGEISMPEAGVGSEINADIFSQGYGEYLLSLTIDTVSYHLAHGQLLTSPDPSIYTFPITLADKPIGRVDVVEFYHKGLDHYFMSANPVEIEALDTGKHKGWARTGYSFQAYDVPVAGASPVCRFYMKPESGDSHFYSGSLQECADTASKFSKDWIQESSDVFYISLPDTATGACPKDTRPVWRFFHEQKTNHRYTAELSLRDHLRVTSDWIAEGYGPEAVIMCTPNR